MTQPNQEKPINPYLAEGLNSATIQASAAQIQQAAALQAEFIRKSGARTIELLERTSALWLHHRRVGIDRTVAAFKRLASVDSPGEAIKVYNDWTVETIQDLVAESQELPEQMISLCGVLVDTVENTGESIAQAVPAAVVAQSTEVRAQTRKAAAESQGQQRAVG